MSYNIGKAWDTVPVASDASSAPGSVAVVHGSVIPGPVASGASGVPGFVPVVPFASASASGASGASASGASGAPGASASGASGAPASQTKSWKPQFLQKFLNKQTEQNTQKKLEKELENSKTELEKAKKEVIKKNITDDSDINDKSINSDETIKKKQEAYNAAKAKSDEFKQQQLDTKKTKELTKLDNEQQKEIDKAIEKYSADDYEERNAEIKKIKEFYKEKKQNVNSQTISSPPPPPPKKQGYVSKLIDKQIDKYANEDDAKTFKEMKKDYIKAFKKGDFRDVNQKYQEKGLVENKDVNEYMNELLANDKIDRRKGIEMLKSRMNEEGVDIEQQKDYVDIMKGYKDDFNLKSFDDKLTGSNPKDKELQELIKKFRNVVEKTSKGRPINLIDKDLYENIDKKIDKIKSEIDQDQSRPQDDDINAIKEYVNSIRSELNIDNNEIIHTTKQIVDFKQVAHYFKLLIKFLATICIIIFLIVLLISFFNVVNLFIKIGVNIISLFYNTVITNNQTISYESKNMIKCTKSDYKYDIFNILNEQHTSLAVFNTIIYIIYILLGYIIIFILLLIFVNIYRYTHVLNGELKDLDPKYQLTSVLIIIFASSFIHLLIYKFCFRNLTLNKFKDIDNYEKNVDIIISKNLQPINKTYDEDFFDLMADASRRTEIDSLLANKVNNIDDPGSDLGKYLFMYDLYMYFDEYMYMNDIVRDDLKRYLNIGDDTNNTENTRTFISFLDANERKLIKAYHEELPFYKQIAKEKLERFQKINEKVSQDIGIINKNIIKFTGTFYPFLFACIYIIGIFFFNVLCTYILMDYILSTERDELFIPIIYKIAKKYKNIIMYIYNIFKK